jgi:hypothetical protein
LLLALIAYGWHDYYYGLTVIDAKIVNIVDDPEKQDGEALLVSVLSDFPPYPFVSDRVRRFFLLAPRICFVKPDGAELVNDDVQSPCSYEDDQSKKWTKMHQMEKSEFLIRFYKVQLDPDGKRDFFNTMVQKRGLWAKFQLVGFPVPPSVESKPFFLSLEPYCKTQPEHCKRIFGW